MGKTMRGILKELPNDSAVYHENLPIPVIGDRDVLVRVHAAAICGTDLHIMHWSQYAEDRLTLPMVFGHEFAGEIVEVGAKVTGYQVGDRIAGETHIPCNTCHQCKTGHRHICENMKIIGVQAPGAFCDYISVPVDCLYKLSDDISYEMGAMLEPMGVAVHGVTDGEVENQFVVILGCGPIGLMAVGAAKAMGARQVVAVDIVAEKLTLAKQMGADYIVNSKDENLAQLVKSYTDGIGADVVIDYTGSGPAISGGFAALRKGGRFVMVGLPGKKVELDLSECIIYKEATVKGATGRLMYETWETCAELLSKKRIDLRPVIGGIYPMRDFEKAFDALYSGAPGKMLLIPEL